MRHNLLTATLFAATMAPGGQADEPAPEKQVAVLSEQHRLAAIKGDTKALDAVLADDWVVVGPTGEVETKRQQEQKLKDKSLVFEAIDPQEGLCTFLSSANPINVQLRQLLCRLFSRAVAWAGRSALRRPARGQQRPARYPARTKRR